jgi:hypothetical protein
MNKEKFEKLKQFVKEQRHFRIEGDIPEYKTLNEFITSFHSGELSTRDNIFIDDESVMRRGKLRSLIDTIIAIEQHTEWVIEDVINYFQELYNQDLLVGHYCNNISRCILYSKQAAPEYWEFHLSNFKLIDIKLSEVYFDDIFEKVKIEEPATMN